MKRDKDMQERLGLTPVRIFGVSGSPETEHKEGWVHHQPRIPFFFVSGKARVPGCTRDEKIL